MNRMLTLHPKHDPKLVVNIDARKVSAVEESGSGTMLYMTGGTIVVVENRAEVFTAWTKALATDGNPLADWNAEAIAETFAETYAVVMRRMSSAEPGNPFGYAPPLATLNPDGSSQDGPGLRMIAPASLDMVVGLYNDTREPYDPLAFAQIVANRLGVCIVDADGNEWGGYPETHPNPDAEPNPDGLPEPEPASAPETAAQPSEPAAAPTPSPEPEPAVAAAPTP